ncbi:MAG: lipoyl(octanoyl) transferase LipB [Planctomycetota bacterium]
MSTAPQLDVHFLGRVSYRAGLALQRESVAEIRGGTRTNSLLLLEHDPVITMGSAARREHLLVSAEDLASRGIEVAATDRGGAATYHGPGQLVGYPLIDLAPLGRDVGGYLRTLEEALIQTVARFGVCAWRDPGKTGVWCDRGKIAAIGLRISRWIAHHGFAINVDPDLANFQCLVPCAIPGAAVATLEQFVSPAPTIAEVAAEVARAVASAFGFDIRDEPRGLPNFGALAPGAGTLSGSRAGVTA